MSSLSPPVVVKVGGSLLDWPPLPDRLSAFLDKRRGDRMVLVVGGGGAADWVRGLDRAHGLGEEKAHVLAIRSLDLTARALASLTPGLDVVEDVASLTVVWGGCRVPVLAPRALLDEEDLGPNPLPHTWDAATDTIAARVAARLGASEIVLLKSAPLPTDTDREEAARLGLVDTAFPAAARPILRVTYINLRGTLEERELVAGR